MNSYKLYLGDCLDILPTLESYSIDAIITDLPYLDRKEREKPNNGRIQDEI